MLKQYTQEQLDKIYENLPKELQESLFSPETAQDIGEVGETYGVIDERLNKIAEYVGYVLMGLILPQEFVGTLEKRVNLPHTLAEAIARDLNGLIFYPVKPALEQLHGIEITPSGKPIEDPEAKEEKSLTEEKPTTPTGKDTYRESIE